MAIRSEEKRIRVYIIDNKEHTPVSTTETLPSVREAGFNNEIYAPRYCCFDFVKSLMSDSRIVDKLHKKITDDRPVIFKMEKDHAAMNQKKMAHGGEICHGNGWVCLVAEEQDAWLAFVVTSDDT